MKIIISFVFLCLTFIQAQSQTIFWTELKSKKIFNKDISSIYNYERASNSDQNLSHFIHNESAKLYWIDSANSTVIRSNIDGTNKETLIAELTAPKEVFLYQNKIFVIDGCAVKQFNQNGKMILNLENINNPKNLYVYASGIYWSDGKSGNILQTDLQGKNLNKIKINTQLSLSTDHEDHVTKTDSIKKIQQPSYITYSGKLNKIFWVDQNTNSIYSSTLVGTEKNKLFIVPKSHNISNISVDEYNQKLYFVQKKDNTSNINRCNFDGTHIEVIVPNIIGQVNNVLVYNQALNTNQTNDEVTWLGINSSSWTNPQNWEGNNLPEDCDDIIITAGTYNPILENEVVARSILLDDNAGLILGSAGYLKIVLDNDCDGVNDNSDTCPDTSSGESVDENGCSIQQRLDAGETPLQIIISGIANAELIGKIYAGGYIFYMDTDSTGLIASFRMPDYADRDGYNIWGCSSVSDPRDADAPTEGNSTSVIGHGQQNTDYITEDGCGVENSGGEIYYNAAETCDRLEVVFGGVTYNDWFFPSRDELEEMYNTIGQGATGQNNNIGNFDNLRYICSNSFTGSSQLAWAIEFQNEGGLYLGNKYTNFAVRAIRDF